MKRFCGLLLLLLGLGIGPAGAQAELVQRVEDSLRAGKEQPVHDLGKLLKPGGVRELELLAREFRAGGLTVRFVTLPKKSADPAALAETVYRDLKYGPGDLLVVFDGSRVYGKSLALQGEPEAFRQAAADARPGFRLYYAKGLALFAQSLRDRIQARRTAAAPASRPAPAPGPSSTPAPQSGRSGGGWGWLWAALALVILATVTVIGVRRAGAQPSYEERLRTAEDAYGRITLAMPDPAPEPMSREWGRLDEQLRRCRDPQERSLARLIDLTTDLKAFERRLAEHEKQS
jgi:hypothetical protein